MLACMLQEPRGKKGEVDAFDRREPLALLHSAVRRVQKGWEDVSKPDRLAPVVIGH